MNWNPFRRPRVTVRVVPSTRLRLTDLTSSPDAVKAAQRIFASPEFQLMLAVLRNESPVNYGIASLAATHDDHIAHAHRCAGYHLCINNLESMADYVPVRGSVEATFSPEPPAPLGLDAFPTVPDEPPTNL